MHDELIAKDNKTSWFSTPTKGMDLDEDYCRFCLSNFKTFHEMVNNVCQSCGRAAPKVIHDKQQELVISSINAPKMEDSSNEKAISLEVDYNPLTIDDTTLGINSSDIRLQANSFREAIKLIHDTDKSPRMVMRAKLDQYKIKSSVSDKYNKKAFLDEKT